MNHRFNKRKEQTKLRIATLSLAALLIMTSLTSCGFFDSSNDSNKVINGAYGSDIKLNPSIDNSTNTNGTSNDQSTDGSSADTTFGDIQIIDPGVLEIYEDQKVTDNNTEFTETVALAEKSVVEIETESTASSWTGQYIQQGAGSGVIIAHNVERSVYYIVTNNHVIDGAESILVRLSDGTEYTNAQLIATDMLTDVALVAIPTAAGTELTTAVFMNQSSTLADGQDIFVIGNPLGELGGSVTKGIISKTERRINVGGVIMNLLQIDAAVNPGNSGGALFDMSGSLIGIVNAKYSDEEVEGIGFAIPINTVRSVAQQLVQKGYVSGRPGLGFDTADKTYTSGSLFGSSTTYPTVISDTTVTGSCTDESGNTTDFAFQKDDIIVAVGETTVNTTAALLGRLASYNIGDTVNVIVYRTEVQGNRYVTKQYDVTVTLVEYVPTSATA